MNELYLLIFSYLQFLLNEANRKKKEELEKQILMQKIYDKVCISIIEQFQQKGQLSEINLEEQSKVLDEDVNIWLKDQFCDDLCEIKNNPNPKFGKIYRDIIMIKKDLKEQRQDNLLNIGTDLDKEKAILNRVLLKRPTRPATKTTNELK
jgi:hypothetical protein